MAINYWKQKLMAFLHDPPNKPLDIAGHEKIREAFLRRAGIDPAEMTDFDITCDHTAAAADRFPFPVPSVLRSDFYGTAETPFRHPLGGSDYIFERPFQSAELAEEHLQDIQSGIILDQIPEEERDWANFFLHWRRWPIESARKDCRTLFLPADTRIPDHSIWVHNSIVSALQGCVEGQDLKPAFLIFQMGPVQRFIEQARSTRDLWSGSYLLSWLIAHALKTVTDVVGPDSVIFPALRAQPIYDLLHRSCLYDRIAYTGPGGLKQTLWERLELNSQDILTPNLPNRFFALAPASKADSIARAAEAAVHTELKRIANASFSWIHSKAAMEDAWRKRFDAQVAAFPQITWQVCPWGDENVEKAIEAFEKLCPYPDLAAERLRQIHTLATEGFKEKERDDRYFTDASKTELNNPGFAWPYYYALTDWLLAARRNTRDFKPWVTDDSQQGTPKDAFSGIEEIIGSEAWWGSVREHSVLKYLFRSRDMLGAMNLIKRVWHRAYLAKEMPLDVDMAVQFDSVPGVAAGKWRNKLLDLAMGDNRFRACIAFAKEAIVTHGQNFSFSLPDKSSPLEEWLKKTDPECFSLNAWHREGGEEKNIPQEVALRLKQVHIFKVEENGQAFGPPPGYFAVIAFDGDEMGKWISGEKTPALIGQLSKSAVDYFGEIKNQNIEKLQRPLSPSYHLQFSEALSNFGLYLVRPILESFNGQLIYSGGDDVLAMVPASSAIDCAEALWLAFRGQFELAHLVKDKFEILGTKGGFVRLKSPTEGQPNWPLVVPGPNAQASVGIAVGHAHSPLQNLIDAARAAEKRAKSQHDRAACAVSVYKRSGEILEWGFKWDSGALELLRCFLDLSVENGPFLSGRFGYALNEWIKPYLCSKFSHDRGIMDIEEFDPAAVIMKEVLHVVRQQSQNLLAEDRQKFLNLCKKYLCHISKVNRSCVVDFPMLFSIANFLARGEE